MWENTDFKNSKFRPSQHLSNRKKSHWPWLETNLWMIKFQPAGRVHEDVQIGYSSSRHPLWEWDRGFESCATEPHSADRKTVYDRLITCKKTNENRNFQKHIPILWQTPHNLHASTNFKHELQIKWRFVWTPCLPDLGINVRVRDHSERQILTVTASVEYGQFSSFPSERSPQTPYIAHLPNPCSLDLQKRCICLGENMCHVWNPMPV